MRTLKKKQAGVSLFIVMVVVLLTAIVVAMGFRSSNFNEIATGNTAEYQRTYEAAQALIHDAELDIMRLSATGATCSGTNCRAYGTITDANTGSGGMLYFPMPDDLSLVQAELLDNLFAAIRSEAKDLYISRHNGCSQADYLKHFYTPGAPNA